MPHTPQILIHKMSYKLPNDKAIFQELSLVFSCKKSALVGRNGIGKSTLFKLIIRDFYPESGSIFVEGTLAYVPQNLSDWVHTETTIAEFFECDKKLLAKNKILAGSLDINDFVHLNDDWEIEDRLRKTLSLFQLDTQPLNRPIKELSGGEITRLALVKAFNSGADFLLLDEPTNHLDKSGREQLYQCINNWQGGLIVISHDRTLLNFMEEIVELNQHGVEIYGGNYDNYLQQKNINENAKQQQLIHAKKQMKKTLITIQATREKHEKKQAYGLELRRSGSIDTMSADAKQGHSERSQHRIRIKNIRLIKQAENTLKSIRDKIEINEKINIKLPKTFVPNGKMILEIKQLSFDYSQVKNQLIQNFDLFVQGPARIALVGDNGSGKTTLIKLILKELKQNHGSIMLGTSFISYLDQQCSLLIPEQTLLKNFMRINPDMNENDSYHCLAQFLFRNALAEKIVKELSSGERLRGLLACVLMANTPPQLLILDEPTNHLDIYSLERIESALNCYQGSMIVISHDQKFLKNIGITNFIYAPFKR